LAAQPRIGEVKEHKAGMVLLRRPVWVWYLVVTTVFTVGLAPLPDLHGHWAYEAVSVLYHRQLVHGYPDGTFRPDVFLGRAELAKLLVTLLGREEAALAARGGTSRYPDVARHWAKGYVETASDFGLFIGFADGTFRPQAFVTRAEFAVVLSRLFPGDAPLQPAFVDAHLIPGWARAGVLRATYIGLFAGYEDGTFRALRQVTRAEAAAVIRRVLWQRSGDFDLVGTVEVWAGGNLTLRTGSGRVSVVATGAQVFRNGMAAVSVQPFDQVGVILDGLGRAVLISALYRSDSGTLAELGADQVAFRRRDGVLVSSGVSTDAVFLRNGRRAAFGELKVGDSVYVVYDVASGLIRAIHGVHVFGEGLILAHFVDQNVLMIAIDRVTAMYGLADGAVIVGRGGRLERSELQAGMTVRLVASGGFISYLEVREGGGGP